METGDGGRKTEDGRRRDGTWRERWISKEIDGWGIDGVGDGNRLGMNSKASGGKPVETGWWWGEMKEDGGRHDGVCMWHGGFGKS